MAAYRTGSNSIKICGPGSKVKVTVIENISQNDEKKIGLSLESYPPRFYKPDFSYVGVRVWVGFNPNLTIKVRGWVCYNFKCKHFLNQSPSLDIKHYHCHDYTKYIKNSKHYQ